MPSTITEVALTLQSPSVRHANRLKAWSVAQIAPLRQFMWQGAIGAAHLSHQRHIDANGAHLASLPARAAASATRCACPATKALVRKRIAQTVLPLAFALRLLSDGALTGHVARCSTVCKACVDTNHHFQNALCAECPSVGSSVSVVISLSVATLLIAGALYALHETDDPRFEQFSLLLRRWVFHARAFALSIGLLPKFKVRRDASNN